MSFSEKVGSGRKRLLSSRALDVVATVVLTVGCVFLAQSLFDDASKDHEEQIASYTAEVYLDRLQIEDRGLDDMLARDERLGSYLPLGQFAVSPSDAIALQVTAPKETVHHLDFAYGLLVLVFGPPFHRSTRSREAKETPSTEPLHHRLCRAREAVDNAVADLQKTAGPHAGLEALENELRPSGCAQRQRARQSTASTHPKRRSCC